MVTEKDYLDLTLREIFARVDDLGGAVIIPRRKTGIWEIDHGPDIIVWTHNRPGYMRKIGIWKEMKSEQ